MLSEREHAFVEAQRVAHLATADAAGVPHVVPVCFAVVGGTVVIAIDGKPKRGPVAGMKRLRNIRENPAVSLVVDHYDEDWSRLGWVMIAGRAEIVEGGPEAGAAHAALRARYAQYRDMALEGLPVIAVRMERATSWGDLDPGE